MFIYLVFKSVNKIINIFSTVIAISLCFLSGVKIGKGVRFKKIPSIIKVKNASITIGENVLINSSNFGYHINMHSKCKILADRKNSQIIIGDNSRIHGTCIHAFNSITIGKNVLIAANCQIIDGNGHLLSFDNPSNRINTFDEGRPIIIEDNVWIGANCFILGGVTIGKGAVIGANSVINKNVPPMTIAAGNPFSIIKSYA